MDALAQAGHPGIAVAILDLDGFKPINDTFGHETGDQVLIEVSVRLAGRVAKWLSRSLGRRRVRPAVSLRRRGPGDDCLPASGPAHF
ncbi:diguanylate cyclase domain-containing protein [Novosphingobium sp. Gsoil 351]|uniref:diguanylate cyclase domain-containing protein n=1 Tax=Novosphingobium sp. Gsoil 351 TaxID=2675225 RepID=UPI00351B92AE